MTVEPVVRSELVAVAAALPVAAAKASTVDPEILRFQVLPGVAPTTIQILGLQVFPMAVPLFPNILVPRISVTYFSAVHPKILRVSRQVPHIKVVPHMKVVPHVEVVLLQPIVTLQ